MNEIIQDELTATELAIKKRAVSTFDFNLIEYKRVCGDLIGPNGPKTFRPEFLDEEFCNLVKSIINGHVDTTEHPNYLAVAVADNTLRSVIAEKREHRG